MIPFEEHFWDKKLSIKKGEENDSGLGDVS